MQRFNLRLNDAETEEKNQVNISNRFAALESLYINMDINNQGE
jgi:hypothetical protein